MCGYGASVDGAAMIWVVFGAMHLRQTGLDFIAIIDCSSLRS